MFSYRVKNYIFCVSSIIFCLTALTGLTGCGTDIPEDKQGYVGMWYSNNVKLIIKADGTIEYERRDGNRTTKISAPIRAFDGDNFIVGLGPIKTTFVVSKPPYPDGFNWKMVVDGVELTRLDWPPPRDSRT